MLRSQGRVTALGVVGEQEIVWPPHVPGTQMTEHPHAVVSALATCALLGRGGQGCFLHETIPELGLGVMRMPCFRGGKGNVTEKKVPELYGLDLFLN